MSGLIKNLTEYLITLGLDPDAIDGYDPAVEPAAGQYELEHRPDEEDSDDGVWVTKDGRELEYREITDAHLGNILRMLLRKALARRLQQLAVYLTAPLPLKDEAFAEFMGDFERHLDESFLDYVHPKYHPMEKEARLRGLQWAPFTDPKELEGRRDLGMLDKVMRASPPPSLNPDARAVDAKTAAANLFRKFDEHSWLISTKDENKDVVAFVRKTQDALRDANRLLPRVFQGYAVRIVLSPDGSNAAPPAVDTNEAAQQLYQVLRGAEWLVNVGAGANELLVYVDEPPGAGRSSDAWHPILARVPRVFREYPVRVELPGRPRPA